MPAQDHQLGTVRFGNFEVDLRSGELRKAGAKLKLSGQPFQLLTILLEHPGEVVTREELQKRLWSDTFVDVERNLNTAINKIREALGDSAEYPRFVETLPRRGYRFIAPVESSRPVIAPAVAPDPHPQARAWNKPVYWALALLGGAIITFAIQRITWSPPGPPRVVGFERLTNDGKAKDGPLGTDGSRVYFTEQLPDNRTVVAQVGVKGGDVTPLSIPLKQPRLLDESKDGSNILLANREDRSPSGNSFWVQPVAGGSPRRVGALLGGNAAFDKDEKGIIYNDYGSVYRVGLDGSSPRKLFTSEGYPLGHRSSLGLRFSPGGDIFRFGQVELATDDMTIMEAQADGTGLRRLFAGCCPEWTHDGRFFLFERQIAGRSNFWSMPAQKGWSWRKKDLAPAQLTAGPVDFKYPLMSKDGKNIFAIGSVLQSEVVRYDLRSREFVPYLSGISAEGLAFSPDGQWVAYTTYPEGMLWRSKADGSERLQLTFTPMRAHMPRWSPDGKQIAFSATVPGIPWKNYIIASAGGTAQRIIPGDQGEFDVDWSPDGHSLVFSSYLVRDTPISIIDLRSGRISILPGSKGLFSPHWSPEGTYISGTSVDSGRLFLFDIAARKWTEIPLPGPGVGYPMWSHDGKYLYFQLQPAPGGLYRIVRLRPGDRKIEDVTQVDKVGRLTTGTFGQWFGLAPDDSPLLARDIGIQEIYSLDVDWQ